MTAPETEIAETINPDVSALAVALTEALVPFIAAPEEPVEEPAPPVPADPDAYTEAEARAFLNKMGLAKIEDFEKATRTFQTAFNLGDALAVDGDFGPKTTEAAKACEAKDYRISDHFRFSEFACKCGGKQAGCEIVKVSRRLLRGLEKMRAKFYPSGLSVLSGYRCPLHNAAVGGSKNSQHKYGMAIDPSSQKVPLTDFLAANISELNGIGYNPDSKKTVSHVDARSGSRVTFRD